MGGMVELAAMAGYDLRMRLMSASVMADSPVTGMTFPDIISTKTKVMARVQAALAAKKKHQVDWSPGTKYTNVTNLYLRKDDHQFPCSKLG